MARHLALLLTLVFVLALLPHAAAQQFGPWSAPVNIGPMDGTGTPLLANVNTVLPESQAFMSKDGLSLYFARLEGGSPNDPQAFWVAKRSSTSESWGEPRQLGPAINAGVNQNSPFVTIDGHWLYFVSTRTTPDANGVLPKGKNDIYVSRRHNKREDFPTDPSGGWQEPVNLSSINTAYGERAPFIFEDEVTGVTTLYFDSNRPGLGGFDIYASTLQPDGAFGPAVRVAEVSSIYSDERPNISRDGLEMYFISDRPGSSVDPATGQRWPDIWVSTRASTLDPWGTPENLDVVNARLGGPPINTSNPYHESSAALSFDGTVLYFTSGGRPENTGGQGWNDVWITTRAKLTGQSQE